MSLNGKRKKYNKDLLAVKYKLHAMMALESYLFYSANAEEFDVDVLGWIGEESQAEIQIVTYMSKEDIFTIRASFLPTKSEGAEFEAEYIHYIYTIERSKVERELLFSLEIPSIISEGERPLEELKSFLFDRLDVVVQGNK